MQPQASPHLLRRLWRRSQDDRALSGKCVTVSVRKCVVSKCYVSAVSAPLDRLYFEAGWACEKVSRTIWRFAWQVMDLLGATKLSSRAAETDVGRML
ncbi:hypothetical protein CN155_32450 [Sinorhizobium meliloti]|nr:hypothetical protein CN155_32450 [Sinorhizobium meliloti]